MEQIWAVGLLLLVSVCWGLTNPWMKKASSGIENIKANNSVYQVLSEIRFLMSKPSYVSAFVLNQVGGVLFLVSLGVCDLSLAVPITNSLALLITTIAGQMMDEEPITGRVWLGGALICAGISLCVYDKTRVS